MESGKKLEANDLDIENRQKLQLLEMYERAFDGPEQQLSLTAVTTFNHLADKYKKRGNLRNCRNPQSVSYSPNCFARLIFSLTEGSFCFASFRATLFSLEAYVYASLNNLNFS